MSKVSLAGNASGTGIFTIASPNSNTDRTLTLPDATGTVMLNAAQSVPRTALPAGSVLQVAQSTSSTTTSSTSTTYADASGLSVTITPTSSTSKFLVLCDLSTFVQADNSTSIGVRLVRDATAIYTNEYFNLNNVNANVALYEHSSCNYLDSPATASAITYKVQLKRTSSAGASYAVLINGSSANTISSITVLEIAA